MPEAYRVVTQGLKEGFPSELAQEKLTALFKSTPEKIQPLLLPNDKVVKKGLDHGSALKYKNALERCGCQCRIESDAVAASGQPRLGGDHFASDPGQVTLSEARLRELQPKLLAPEQWKDDNNRKAWVKLIADQLEQGDSRAAVVVNAKLGIVAAYTDELDCVALLEFDPAIARAKGWQTGTRLLTVNVYVGKEQGIASDLVLGPKEFGSFGNFRPLIADLLTDDLERVEYRKQRIFEDEWLRAPQMGEQALAGKVMKPRDGRPLSCGTPAKVESKANLQSHANPQKRAPVKEPQTAAKHSIVGSAKEVAGLLLCSCIVWSGVSHVRSMPVNGLYFLAWFGIIIFAVIGVQCARTAVRGI